MEAGGAGWGLGGSLRRKGWEHGAHSTPHEHADQSQSPEEPGQGSSNPTDRSASGPNQTRTERFYWSTDRQLIGENIIISLIN